VRPKLSKSVRGPNDQLVAQCSNLRTGDTVERYKELWWARVSLGSIASRSELSQVSFGLAMGTVLVCLPLGQG
jgi:hypothetical protein